MIDYRQRLAQYYTELERRKVVWDNKSNFQQWLFEYACQTAEWEGISPLSAVNYLAKIQCDKIVDVLKTANLVYEQCPNIREIKVQSLDLKLIPTIVRNEHGGGKPLRR